MSVHGLCSDKHVDWSFASPKQFSLIRRTVVEWDLGEKWGPSLLFQTHWFLFEGFEKGKWSAVQDQSETIRFDPFILWREVRMRPATLSRSVSLQALVCSQEINPIRRCEIDWSIVLLHIGSCSVWVHAQKREWYWNQFQGQDRDKTSQPYHRPDKVVALLSNVGVAFLSQVLKRLISTPLAAKDPENCRGVRLLSHVLLKTPVNSGSMSKTW